MLAHLSIRNFALIDRLELELEPGLSVVTGETGAGKSITFDAISLLLGGRASAEVIRRGEDEAIIQGLFEVGADAGATVRRVLDAAGLPMESDQLLVRRIVSRAGRNRVYVNDSLATVSLLRPLLEPMVDLLGQHQHLTLMRTETHRDVIDEFAGHTELLEAMRVEFQEWKKAARALAGLEEARAARAERLEFLRFQKRELEGLDLRVGEYEELETELGRARNLGKLREAAFGAESALSSDRRSALERLGDAQEALRKGAAFDDALAGLAARLEEARILTEDLAHDVARYASALGSDDDLDALETRHEQIRRAIKKFGMEPEEMIARIDEIMEEMSRLENFEESLQDAKNDERAAHARAMKTANVLRESRRQAARELFSGVRDVLAELSMPHARFDVVLGEGEKLTVHGVDDVEILFSANAGEDVAPLRKIASGGELSRLMLALKTVLVASDPVSTYIFDEVDTGIGGATAETVGRLLARLAQRRQVLCITHLPQIAAFGANHLHVAKQVRDERTSSSMTALDDDARVTELARMLGGAELTEATVAHARDMLARR